MTLHESLRVMRRWRSVILAGVLVGLLVGWVSATSAAPKTTTFAATQTLIFDPQARGGSELGRIAVLATLGPVRDRVAARLRLDRQSVGSMVSAVPSGNVGLLLITGRSTDRAQAEALANVTAEELIVELGGSHSPLRTLEPAVASPVKSDDIKAPTSRPGRALLLGAFGLVLGIGAAFAVERFDNRIRAKGTAEEALGLPVLAEVPPIPRADHGRMLTGREASPFVEAYRGLRTSVVRSAGGGDNGAGPRVIAVTSATGGEGKTTTVAHLAATLGEIGHSVVAVSADLRRPQLHTYFSRPLEPGLSDVLRGAPDTRRLSDLNTSTGIRGVRLVASGAPVRNPGPLLDQLGDHLGEARKLGEFVLVDTPPLLVASEAADIARQADAVLLVVRAGRTSIGAAARAAEMLERLNVPLLGAVLVGGDETRRRR
jgi:capsular exopolysaccharide synthesis family protein